MGKTSQRDLAIAYQRLDNQKMRFVIWGQSLGLDKGPHAQEAIPELRKSPPLARNIEQNMKLIISLFKDGDELGARYGLEQYTTPSQVYSHKRGASLTELKEFGRLLKGEGPSPA